MRLAETARFRFHLDEDYDAVPRKRDEVRETLWQSRVEEPAVCRADAPDVAPEAGYPFGTEVRPYGVLDVTLWELMHR